jgi:enolase-phosphatase E1
LIDFTGRIILLDIEGTTSSVAHVYGVLFPFARRELGRFLAERWDDAAVRDARLRIEQDAGRAAMPREEFAEFVLSLMDRDLKVTGLKQLQGLIWERGYQTGELRSHVFKDVSDALLRWRNEKIAVYIYSSGSIAAQKLFFAHTESGDLTPYLSGYFDTTSGPKQSSQSYRNILTAVATSAEDVLFVSDVPAELEAASQCGIQVVLADRPGNQPTPGTSFARIASFAQIRAMRRT